MNDKSPAIFQKDVTGLLLCLGQTGSWKGGYEAAPRRFSQSFMVFIFLRRTR